MQWSRPSREDAAIVIVGMMAAAVAGVLVYRSLATYGAASPGVVASTVSAPQAPVPSAQPAGGAGPPDLVKVGLSTNNDGVINAWAYLDPTGATVRVEVSRGADGVIDRWEYYESGQLARAEQDDDHDGRIDRWFTYDAGILIEERGSS